MKEQKKKKKTYCCGTPAGTAARDGRRGSGQRGGWWRGGRRRADGAGASHDGAARARPFDGVVLDAGGRVPSLRCQLARGGGRRFARADGVSAPARDTTSAAPNQGRTLPCPACRAALAPWRLAHLQIGRTDGALGEGWLAPARDAGDAGRGWRNGQLQRRRPSPASRRRSGSAMAREIAAETADAAPDPELPLVQRAAGSDSCLPVVTRIPARERDARR